MKIITKKEYYKLLENWFNDKDIGRNTYVLIVKEDKLYLGIDNSTNEFWTEEFETFEEAKKYAGGNIPA